MEHTMRLNPAPFLLIQSREKTIELRLCDEKRQRIQVGDTILFTHRDDAAKGLYAKVLALHIFPSFQELYDALQLAKCGYTLQTLPYAKASDMEEYYPKEEQKRFGVVGIEICLLREQ